MSNAAPRTESDSVPTFESRPLPGTARLFVHRTRRFKTAALKIRLLEPLDDNASARALLSGLLRRGTRNSPDLRAITRRLEELYGAGMTLDLVRIGEQQATDCAIQFVHSRARGIRDVLPEALCFQRELLAEPNLDAGGFPADRFEQERKNLEAAIRAVADDKASFAHQRLVEIAFSGEPYARADHGSLQDVEKLERGRVAQYHLDRLRRTPTTVFAIGDLDDADESRIVEFTMSLASTLPAIALEEAQIPEVFPTGRYIEEVESGQSHLLIAHRFDPRGRSREQSIALSLAATVLGGGAHSLLFREVRERAALCYATHASLDRQKGFMLCYAGIARAAYDQAAELVREQVARLKRGDFEDAALEAARSALEHSVRTAFDSPWRALDFAARADATGWPIDAEAYLAAIQGCDRDLVTTAADEFRETICYLAAGVDDAADRE